jgi:glutaredoxin
VDTKYSHANWAWDLGGICFPLLADFHPRGEVAHKFGVYLDQAGITDRATVIIDTDGVVRHVSSVTPSGKRNIDELFALAKELNGGKQFTPPLREGKLHEDATLYVREGCRFCQSVKRAITNLHIEPLIKVRDVEKEPAARKDLDAIAGAGAKVPTLVQNGVAQHESADIIRTLAELHALR